MKKIIITMAIVLATPLVYAQVPQSVNYQAVARDAFGNPLINTAINLTFEILQGSGSGTVAYTETHNSTITTNDFGLFTAPIGGGTTTDNFSAINWSGNLHFLRITVNGDVMPATQLLSVPYALHAGTAATGTPGADGADGIGISWEGNVQPTSPTLNMAYYDATLGQSLIWDGAAWQQMTQDGNTATFIAGAGITITGSTISATDTSVTNEIQVLTIVGDTVYLSNGGNSVVLPNTGGDAWGNQSVITDATLGGNGLAGAPLKVINPLPATGAAGDILRWDGANWIAGTDSINDADNDPSNEIQNLSITGNTINISGGTGTSLTNPAPTATNQVLTWNGTSWVAQNPGSGADNWGSQVVIADGVTITGTGVSGDTLRGFDGQYSSLSGTPTNVSSFTNDVPYLTTFTEVDGSVTNELQTISASGGANPQIDLSNTGGNVQFAGAGGTTVNQTGNIITINTPTGTDNQDLGSSVLGSNRTITITGGNPTTINIDDADANSSNELITTFDVNGGDLRIIEGGATHTVPLSSLGDGDGIYDGSGALSGNTVITGGSNSFSLTSTSANAFSIDGTTFSVDAANNRVGIGPAVPSGILHTHVISPATPALVVTNGNITSNTAPVVQFGANSSAPNAFRLQRDGNVGIGAVTATATLHVDGTLRLDNLGSTNSSGDVLTAIDAQGNAQWMTPATPISFWNGSAGVIYPTNISDFVGVGTLSPQDELHITSASPAIRLEDNNSVVGAATALINMYDNSSNIQMEMGLSTLGGVVKVYAPNEDLHFMTYDGSSVNTRMKVSGTNGFVGIGQVGIPTALLTVQPKFGTTSSSIAHFNNGAFKKMFNFSFDGANNANLKMNNASEITQIELNAVGVSWFNGGNVGIGTTNPTRKLQIQDNSSNFAMFIQQGASAGSGLNIYANISSSTQSIFQATNNSVATSFYVKGNGNVGIGTSSPSQKLDVDNGGSVEVDGEYTYENVKTHYQSYAPTTFRTLLPDIYDFGTNSAANFYTYFRSGGTSFGYATVGVNLPDGAIVTDLEGWVWDNLSTNPIRVTLYRQQLGSDALVSMAEIESSTATATASVQYLIDGTILNSTIDNSTYSYFLMFTGRQNSTDSRLYGAKVTYTVRQAD